MDSPILAVIVAAIALGFVVVVGILGILIDKSDPANKPNENGA